MKFDPFSKGLSEPHIMLSFSCSRLNAWGTCLKSIRDVYLHLFKEMFVSWCTLVQALRLCTGRTDHRGSRGIALLFHDHGTRRGWGVSVTPRPLFTPGKDPAPIVQEAGWAPGPVWTGAENLAPTGFDPRTLQPVVSRYTDWATRPTSFQQRRYVIYTFFQIRKQWNRIHNAGNAATK